MQSAGAFGVQIAEALAAARALVLRTAVAASTVSARRRTRSSNGLRSTARGWSFGRTFLDDGFRTTIVRKRWWHN